MFKKAGILFSALVFHVALGASAATLQINSCDAAAPSKSTNSAVTTISGGQQQEGAAALRLTLASTQQDTNPYVWYYVSDSTQWKNYQGIRFWVRSTTGCDWGIMEIIYSANYYRFYAGFEITDTWTEVTLPWREFVQRNYQGTIDSIVALPNPDIQVIGFTIKPDRRIDTSLPSIPLAWRGPVTYDVDDIRLVNGITPSPTPVPSTVGLPISAPKAMLQQPLKILVLGDSITYGNQLPDRTTQAWPAVLQGMLRSGLGYNNVTVVNFGIGGKEYWEYAVNVKDFVEREAPDLILAAFMTNDANSASGGNLTNTGNIGNFRDNVNRSLDIFLRYNQADLAVVVPPPNIIGGKNNDLDPWAAQIKASADERHLLRLNVYDGFMALPIGTLSTYYVADNVHLSVAGQQAMAQIVYDELMPYLQSTDIVAPQVNVTHAVLSGTVSDTPNPPPATVKVAGVDYNSISGAWTAGDVTVAKGVDIQVIATDASSNSRTVNVNIDWP